MNPQHRPGLASQGYLDLSHFLARLVSWAQIGADIQGGRARTISQRKAYPYTAICGGGSEGKRGGLLQHNHAQVRSRGACTCRNKVKTGLCVLVCQETH